MHQGAETGHANPRFWALIGIAAFALLPWYALDYGLFDATADELFGAFAWRKGGSLPIAATLVCALFALRPWAALDRMLGARIEAALAMSALVALFVAGKAMGVALGLGAAFDVVAFGAIAALAFARMGFIRGDGFMTGSILLIGGLVIVFILFPISTILLRIFVDMDGAFTPFRFFEIVTSYGFGRVLMNSLVLAVAVALSTTFLGFVFALYTVRAKARFRSVIRIFSILPIITPPFVIALAIILLFGRSGAVSTFLEWAFGIEPSRWIYGLFGTWLSQMLAFTPIAFLVLIGVVEGISPAMEEAAQTLRAKSWRTFMTVSLPLMRPGLANAFLVGFIESLADFGNPMVLGGDFEVLSTSIFFSIVGSQNDMGRAAVLGIVLLAFTLSAFYAQRRWLGRKSYTTVTGKGDSGIHPDLPKGLVRLIYGAAVPWAVFTFVIYAMIMFGGFVKLWGYDHSFTLQHYIDAFGVAWGEHGIVWAGAAWNSFGTTMIISAIAAPLTAGIGLLTAYLLVRQRFHGRDAFEFGTMLSFAIPGTVIGVSYILAFNVPPFELTGTGAILVICFVFRNMPVGVRAGIASMSQIDQSLDESSLTLGASSFTTLRRVVLPLLRPAIIAALVFSFVRAITAISAVIFLVSARYDMATSYIIGRVENGDYGLAIAYSSVLIVVMVVVILGVQVAVGERKLGRRGTIKAKGRRTAMEVGIP